jgi:hypothetical protein
LGRARVRQDRISSVGQLSQSGRFTTDCGVATRILRSGVLKPTTDFCGEGARMDLALLILATLLIGGFAYVWPQLVGLVVCDKEAIED